MNDEERERYGEQRENPSGKKERQGLEVRGSLYAAATLAMAGGGEGQKLVLLSPSSATSHLHDLECVTYPL